VIPEPVVTDDWRPAADFGTADEASIELQLPPGQWELSLQYHSPVGIELEGPGLAEELPASLDGMFAFAPGEGPFWPAGSIEDADGDALTITVRQQPLSGLQELFGVERTTWLGTLAATRPDRPADVPLTEACGQYVDWFATAD
jgi:hypothetical protein